MSRAPKFRFRLYVAESSQNSMQAVANLNALCKKYLPQQHHIEIIDVFNEPMAALADSVFMTPTLLKLSPAPAKRIVGTLAQTELVLNTLGLGITEPA